MNRKQLTIVVTAGAAVLVVGAICITAARPMYAPKTGPTEPTMSVNATARSGESWAGSGSTSGDGAGAAGPGAQSATGGVSPGGEVLEGDADAEDESTLGCNPVDPESDPKPACHTLRPAAPPPSNEQLDLTSMAEAFVRVYATYSTREGKAAWRSSVSPYTGGKALPVTAAARLAVADHGVSSEISWYSPIEAISTFVGVNADGSWQYSVLGVVKAQYVQYSATWLAMYLHGDWRVNVSASASHHVISVTEDIAELKDTPQ